MASHIKKATPEGGLREFQRRLDACPTPLPRGGTCQYHRLFRGCSEDRQSVSYEPAFGNHSTSDHLLSIVEDSPVCNEFCPIASGKLHAIAPRLPRPPTRVRSGIHENARPKKSGRAAAGWIGVGSCGRQSALLVLPVGDQIVDDSGIGQRRGVAQRAEFVLGDLAQYPAHDLAGAGLGKTGRELDLVR